VVMNMSGFVSELLFIVGCMIFCNNVFLSGVVIARLLI